MSATGKSSATGWFRDRFAGPTRGPATVRPTGTWPRTALALPFIGMALVVCLDYFSTIEVTVEPALTAVPALAAIVSRRVWYPILTGLLAEFAAFALAGYNHVLGESVHSATVFAIALVTAISWVSATLRVRQEQALADAQLVAEIARRVLLRSVPDRVGSVRAAVHYAAAAAHARIGGDLYEVVNTRHGVRAVVGDVRGKGLSAVETAAAVLGAFREAAHQEPALDKVAGWLAVSLDRALHEHEHPGVEEEFVTLVLIGVAPDGSAEIVNCGHPAPLLLRADGVVRALELAETVPPLGVLDPADVAPPVQRVPFEPGDRVLLFTDGVIEARDRAGRFYPLAERLPGCAAGGPVDVLDRLHADVVRHVGRQLGDDAAMLLLQYEPVVNGGPQQLPHQNGRLARQ
ncbi:PP2C family protein-serine/threonine phosphatase [Kitasatospora sp. GAS204B]|uniref:PP2C family protein-serine/threonine phosphatase n=1 Tax=unclassified Kitasatospora TaxID=2633591 RepID=UPI002474156B|nr:PP2C family protein-serine/threonine phosphatase [Kitasatospora sp. GAS204B]MDH6116491.1 serine phosphatase RsbU (regulator of sigma subunit) [Kitasatospora sp. GAS204B]